MSYRKRFIPQHVFDPASHIHNDICKDMAREYAFKLGSKDGQVNRDYPINQLRPFVNPCLYDSYLNGFESIWVNHGR